MSKRFRDRHSGAIYTFYGLEQIDEAESAAPAPAAEPTTVLAKIKALRDAITALEGEEIEYRAAMTLSAAARVCREYIKANEAGDE